MRGVKLLAVDLDNTLLTADKRISKENQYWIQKIRDEEIKVVLATGRGIQRTQKYLEKLALTDPLILVNGAELWKRPGELLERHTMTGKEVRALIRLAQENGAGFWGYNLEGMVRSEDWADEMFEKDWLKIGIKHQSSIVIQDLRKQVRGWGRYSVTQSDVLNIEISSPGISKAYGLKKICDYLEIDLNFVMAIGDNLNDLEMIKIVGLGVAVENGVEELKEAAAFITASNEENGVAKAIQHHIFKID